MRRAVILAIVLAVFSVAPVLAEQVIHFSNGNSMPVRSHAVQGEMIHVDLGGDAFMAFPLEMVDKVVEAGKNVILDQSFADPKGVMVDTRAPGAKRPVRAARPGGSRRDEMFDAIAARDAGRSKVEVNENGVAAYKPYATSGAANRRGLGATGSQRVMGARGLGSQRAGGGFGGTTRVGNRHVIGSTAPPGSPTRRPPVSMERNLGGPPPPPPPPPPSDEGSDE